MVLLRGVIYTKRNWLKDLCYSIGGCAVLEVRLQHLCDEVGALHMVHIAKRHGEIHMFL